MKWLIAHRYLVARRITQVAILVLFWCGAHLHLGVLTGNLSASHVFRVVPLADPHAVLQILFAGHLVAGTALTGAALVLLFYFVVGGRSFCAWVCPVNPLSDGARWLEKRLGLRGQFRVSRSVRFWVLGLGLVVSALSGVAAFEWVSPIGMLHRGLIFLPGLGLSVVGILLLLDLFVVRDGWCGSLCPLGAFYSIVGRHSWIRIGFDAERCDRCGECVKVCPERHVLHFEEMTARRFVASGDCTNCARCLEICPTEAFRFVKRPGSLVTKTKHGGDHANEVDVHARVLDPSGRRPTHAHDGLRREEGGCE